jgi:hypothetical protein
MKANAAIWISVLTLCLPMSAMAAGDVSAELTKKGDLKIKGTNEGNQIMVTNDGLQNVLVVGMPGTDTTINGSPDWTFLDTDADTVPRRLDINLGKGDNYVEIDDINVLGDLRIKLGVGDGTIGIFDADLSEGVSIKLGNGSNLVAVADVAILDKLDVKGSSGNDAIAIADCVATGGKTKIKTGSGDDVLLLQGTYSDALKLDSGKDADQLYVTRYESFDDANIKLGSDDDGIWVTSMAIFSPAVKLNGAKGTDTQTIAPTTIFNAKTKGIEVFNVDANTDVVPDNIAAALVAEYVARGGDAADISCP